MSVMMDFTRMVQQQECARMMVDGMAVYPSAFEFQEQMVKYLHYVLIIQWELPVADTFKDQNVCPDVRSL